MMSFHGLPTTCRNCLVQISLMGAFHEIYLPRGWLARARGVRPHWPRVCCALAFWSACVMPATTRTTGPSS